METNAGLTILDADELELVVGGAVVIVNTEFSGHTTTYTYDYR